jgi:hypothetical protein
MTVATVIAAAVAIPPGAATRARAAAEAESFALLARARSPAELREVVGPLGAVLALRGGGWVAIRYRDSHAAPGWSSAVARDSGGAWFTSGEHFCGRFQLHRQLRERGEKGLTELRAVEGAESLEAARGLLVGLGFHRVPAP